MEPTYDMKNWGGECTGLITNINVFSTNLTVERMEAITKGQECGAAGDYLSWEESEWKLTSAAKVEMIPYDNVCTVAPKVNVFTAAFEHKDCMEFCEKIGSGRSPQAHTNASFLQFSKELLNLTSHTEFVGLPDFWLSPVKTDDPELNEKVNEVTAATGLRVESEPYKDYYTGEPMDKGLMTSNQVFAYLNTVTKITDCLFWLTKRSVLLRIAFWKTNTCEDRMACSCGYARPPILRLRGLCQATISGDMLDRTYTPHQHYDNAKDVFHLGIYRTRITYDHTSSKWIMENTNTGDKIEHNHLYTFLIDFKVFLSSKYSQIAFTSCKENRYALAVSNDKTHNAAYIS